MAEQEEVNTSLAGPARSTIATNTNALDIVLGPLKSFRQKGSPVEHVTVPLQYKYGNSLSSIYLETPLFSAPIVYTFSGNNEQEGKRKSLLIENGACQWLETALRDIVRLTFPNFLKVAQENKDKLPVICRRLLAPGANCNELVRDYFNSNQNGHWFKVHEDCKIYNVDTLKELDCMEGYHRGDYKAIIHVKGYYLGQQGAGSNACCSLNCVIEQLLVRPKKSEVPNYLLMKPDDFFSEPFKQLEGVVEEEVIVPEKPAEEKKKKQKEKALKRHKKAELNLEAKERKKDDIALSDITEFYSQMMEV